MAHQHGDYNVNEMMQEIVNSSSIPEEIDQSISSGVIVKDEAAVPQEIPHPINSTDATLSSEESHHLTDHNSYVMANTSTVHNERSGGLPPRLKCIVEGCTKLASRKGISKMNCIAHGGGKRCSEEGCNRTAARTGGGEKAQFCLLHGGGRRCSTEGCEKLAVSPTQMCKAHGGGKRCTYEGCTRSARWPKDVCISHGGGLRCATDGCGKLAKAKGGLCIAHSRNENAPIAGIL